jgi:hypothetical protein
MSKELNKSDHNDPFAEYGRATRGRRVVGRYLKFNKGDYLAGQDSTEIPIGTRLMADMGTLEVGWIKWVDKKPADQDMGLLGDTRYKLKRRDELGDTDKDLWEVDQDGKHRDPWVLVNQIVLLDPDRPDLTDEAFTFTTSSKGGLRAIGGLCEAYSKERRMLGNVLPVVELGVETYDHEQYGRLKSPKFKIVGWTSVAELTGQIEDKSGEEPPFE